jgi:calcineurin-like phosphoesterase family protein
LSRLALGVLLVCALVGAAARPAAPAPTAVTLLAAGDIASCASTGDEATAAILARQKGTVAVLGDAVYERGTAEEFRDCYAPTWGRFRARTRAALGNHEYGTPSAAPAIAYFGLPARGWYAYSLGAWRIVVLNSNCSQVGGCGAGSPQWRWLRSELAARPRRCTLAYMHHPRWSSGLHGSDGTMSELWRLLASARADVVLAGHDHHYERFAPIDGIRSFVVGTGGKSHYPVLQRLPSSRAYDWTTFGVLRLELRADGYAWRFLPEAGRTFADSGNGRCR